VTNRKNGQKSGQIVQNDQMRFFIASALQKWPNFLKLAMKWPSGNPAIEHCYCNVHLLQQLMQMR